ncbi:hypothetical protein BN1321_380055 [Staphylococcus aureus]|uniref:Uncharacterized protein n=1 Tax=Staphylococcus aureus TaxID=1280 RepID=A0A0U1MSE8_STAAU|nr:hypothetical protein BN1321_380055 [Staphylococcus aureus]
MIIFLDSDSKSRYKEIGLVNISVHKSDSLYNKKARTPS